METRTANMVPVCAGKGKSSRRCSCVRGSGETRRLAITIVRADRVLCGVGRGEGRMMGRVFLSGESRGRESDIEERPPARFKGARGPLTAGYCGAAVVGDAGGTPNKGRASACTFVVVWREGFPINIDSIPPPFGEHMGTGKRLYDAVSQGDGTCAMTREGGQVVPRIQTMSVTVNIPYAYRFPKPPARSPSSPELLKLPRWW